MPATVVVRRLVDGRLVAGGEELLEAPGTPESPVWVDVLAPDADAMHRLQHRFGLHPLNVEDVLHYPQRPKIDPWDPRQAFLVWIVPAIRDTTGLCLQELDIFLAEEFIVTAHVERLDALERVAEGAEEALAQGTDWALHGILDHAVDGMLPLLDRIGDRLEDIEDELLRSAERSLLAELQAQKRALVAVHKVVAPEREIIRGLARTQALVDREAFLYFQDIGDHLARVEDTVETYREVVSGAMDIYLSSVSNRLNEIMKRLTILATIFGVLTVITGIYGMNFEGMPELRWRFGYLAVLGVMAVIVGWMLLEFKRRDWW